MSEQTPTPTQAPKEDKTPPSQASTQNLPNLIVELGDERNRQITIDTLKVRLRGRWSGPGLMAKTGRSLGEKLAGMPDIPGIRIAIYMITKEIRIYDPLDDPKNAQLLETINAAGRKARQRSSKEPWKGVPEVRKVVDDDVIKTLLLEIHMHLNKPQPSMKIKSGQLPDKPAIEKLPGRQLYDPWSNNPYKPKYVDEFQAWAKNQRAMEALQSNIPA